MATFAQLVEDVMGITGRPDRIAQTKLAVRAATLKAHQSDFFFRDIQELPIKWDTPEYQQQLNVRELVPNFRALKYIRSVNNGVPAGFIEAITTDELFDQYSRERTNICYMAGDLVQIKTSGMLQFALLGVYTNPEVTESLFKSWVADIHPFYIVYEAARTVFKQIGFDEQAAQFDAMAKEQLNSVKMTGLTQVGY